MTHTMQLTPAPFDMIRNGTKTIELRLYDDKRKKIRPGDQIIFVNTEDPSLTIETKVSELFVFESFAALYRNLPLLECGYTEKTISNARPEDMNVYYPEEKQRQFGVVGIKLVLL